MKLSETPLHTPWVITHIADDELKIRLLELGFHLGTKGVLVRKAPLGGPLTISNAHTDIMLRKEDAKYIEVSENKPQ